MRLPRPSHPFALGTLLAVVTLASAGGGWWLWQQNQSLASDNAELKSELERGGDSSGGGGVLGVSSNSGFQGAASGSTTSGPTTPASDSGTGSSSSGLRTLLVKDFGIKLSVPPSLSDLSYAESPPASGFMQLTTVSLAKAHPCAAAGILGTVFRYPKDQSLPNTAAAAKATKVALAGGYEYYYLALDKNPCTDKASQDAVASLTSELKQALSSLTTD